MIAISKVSPSLDFFESIKRAWTPTGSAPTQPILNLPLSDRKEQLPLKRIAPKYLYYQQQHNPAETASNCSSEILGSGGSAI